MPSGLSRISQFTAGDFRLVASPIRVEGFEPEYRPAPVFDAVPQSS